MNAGCADVRLGGSGEMSRTLAQSVPTLSHGPFVTQAKISPPVSNAPDTGAGTTCRRPVLMNVSMRVRRRRTYIWRVRGMLRTALHGGGHKASAPGLAALVVANTASKSQQQHARQQDLAHEPHSIK